MDHNNQSIIEIKTKLLILADKVRVPGFEPLTEQTIRSLSIAYQGRDSYVPLCEVLRLIPNAKVIISSLGQGMAGTEKYLELPSGPINGNDCRCPEDWYKIIRDVAGERMVISDANPMDRDEIAEFDRAREYDYNDFSRDLDRGSRENHL